MKTAPDFVTEAHDPKDPNPWLALYLDRSTPLPEPTKRAWLADTCSPARQYLLPFLRPLARACIVLVQVVKVFTPRKLAFSKVLHRILAWGLRNFLRPDANWLILRHFHLGSQSLAFIAANAPVSVPTAGLFPQTIDDLADEVFLKHDLNLFNFVICLNKAMNEIGASLSPVAEPDFSMIEEPSVRLEDMPRRWTNFIDLQSGIELFTPVYQLFLSDSDFWRATNSLQLDETIGIYVATLLNARDHLILVNNRHPLVPMSTLRAGFRLTLHGLSTEMLHAFLVQQRALQAQRRGQAERL